MGTISIEVSNVKCDGCTSIIENGLKILDGIDTVVATIEGGNVTVTGTTLNKVAIRNKLNELGFPQKCYPEKNCSQKDKK